MAPALRMDDLPCSAARVGGISVIAVAQERAMERPEKGLHVTVFA